MSPQKNWNPRSNLQFLCYLVISSLAALVNVTVGFSLYGILGLSTEPLYSFSVAIGYLTGMVVNWSLNRAITFPRSGRGNLAEVRTFFVIALLGLFLTVVLAAAFRTTFAPYVTEVIAD